MAGGAAKRTAAQNEASLKNLRIAMLSSTAFSLVVRLFFIRRSGLPSFFSIVFLVLSYVPSTLIYNYLVNLGAPRRDQSGQLIGSGGDLSQGGITEYAFDILYVTCKWPLLLDRGIDMYVRGKGRVRLEVPSSAIGFGGSSPL